MSIEPRFSVPPESLVASVNELKDAFRSVQRNTRGKVNEQTNQTKKATLLGALTKCKEVAEKEGAKPLIKILKECTEDISDTRKITQKKVTDTLNIITGVFKGIDRPSVLGGRKRQEPEEMVESFQEDDYGYGQDNYESPEAVSNKRERSVEDEDEVSKSEEPVQQAALKKTKNKASADEPQKVSKGRGRSALASRVSKDFEDGSSTKINNRLNIKKIIVKPPHKQSIIMRTAQVIEKSSTGKKVALSVGAAALANAQDTYYFVKLISSSTSLAETVGGVVGQASQIAVVAGGIFAASVAIGAVSSYLNKSE